MSFRVFQWKFAHSPECERRGEDGEYAAFLWKYRRDKALAVLREHATTADVVMMQGVRGYNVDSVKRVLRQSMNSPWIGLSQYGLCRDQNGETDFLVLAVRGASEGVTQLDVRTQRCLAVTCMVKSRPCLFATVHFPVGESDRMALARDLGTALRPYVLSSVVSVVAGDMNAFPEARAGYQLQNLMANGMLYDASQWMVRRSDGKRCTSTFKPYPYDKVIVPEETDKLDYILARGTTTHACVAVDDQPACVANDETGETHGPSDHHPVVAELHVVMPSERTEPAYSTYR